MVTNNNYPIMSTSEESLAPWNEVENEVEVEVLISISLSKKVKVNVPSISESVNYDEDGNPYIDESDISDIELEKAVMSQVFLPQEVSENIENYLNRHNYKINPSCKKILDDGSNWDIDEFTVMKND